MSCIIESRDRPALVACCCEKVWPEGDTYDIYGGKACFLCLNGRCPRTLIERIADLEAREEAPDL